MHSINRWLLLLVIAACCTLPARTLGRESESPVSRLESPSAQAAATPQVKLPPGISLDVPLTEEDAMTIALWNNAAFRADLEAMNIAKADLMEAGQLRNPTLQLLLPFGYKQFEMLFNLPAEVLWQRPARVQAARIEVERVAQNLEQSGLDFMRDVRSAYWNLALSVDRRKLAEDAARLRREILTITEARLRAGDISEQEAIAARLDLSEAEQQSARSVREQALIKGRLRYLIGLENDRLDFSISSRSATSDTSAGGALSPEPSLEALQAEAFASRPDLQGAVFAIEAAAKRAKWERSRLFAFAGLLSIKRGAGLDLSPRGGILAELPVFQQNQGAITRADAEVERAGIQYLATHHRIAQEVREAHSLFLQARDSLQHYQNRIVPQAEQGVKLAEMGYRAGDESYLFVLEAGRRLIDARVREVELLNDRRQATVQLDRSIGRKHDINR
jgi:cobalt-zinc-cadmium efflux system outer membrane protein